MGVDVDPDEDGDWQLIDYDLDEKNAVTVWRAMKYSNSIHANENVHQTIIKYTPFASSIMYLKITSPPPNLVVTNEKDVTNVVNIM